jgi:hypothetical protein
MTFHTFKAIAWPAGGWAVLVDGKLVRLIYATRDEAENVACKLTTRYNGHEKPTTTPETKQM